MSPSARNVARRSSSQARLHKQLNLYSHRSRPTLHSRRCSTHLRSRRHRFIRLLLSLSHTYHLYQKSRPSSQKRLLPILLLPPIRLRQRRPNNPQNRRSTTHRQWTPSLRLPNHRRLQSGRSLLRLSHRRQRKRRSTIHLPQIYNLLLRCPNRLRPNLLLNPLLIPMPSGAS